MLFLDPQKNTTTSLLTIPVSDFPSLQKNQKHTTTTTNTTTNTTTTNNERLLLLQLPNSITVEDVLPTTTPSSSPPSARILIQEEPTDDDHNDYNDNDTGHNNGGCHLILENKAVSFTLIKAASSNAYVLVPPMTTTTTTKQTHNPNDNDNDNDNDEASSPPPPKKPKPNSRSQGGSLLTLQNARLLHETDTHFLECIPHHKDEARMRRRVRCLAGLLAGCVYPPSSSSSADDNDDNRKKGYTISEMAHRVACSRRELMDMLQSGSMDGKAFPLPPPPSKNTQSQEPQRYGTLEEETKREVVGGIVSTLTEWDGGVDYGERGVVWKEMVEEVVKRVEGGEWVVRYCLERCRVGGEGGGGFGGIWGGKVEGFVRLDVDKIAIYVAHLIFQSKPSNHPWTESTLLTEWTRLLPGVGPSYNPRLDLLRGIAIRQRRSDMVASADADAVAAVASGRRDVDDANDDDDGGGGGEEKEGEGGKEEEEEGIWTYLPKESLPLVPSERVVKLFRVRDRWRLCDLEPYLEEVVQCDGGVVEILMRYAVPDGGGEGDGVWYVAKRFGEKGM